MRAMQASCCMGVQGCLRAPIHGFSKVLHQAEYGVGAAYAVQASAAALGRGRNLSGASAQRSAFASSNPCMPHGSLLT